MEARQSYVHIKTISPDILAQLRQLGSIKKENKIFSHNSRGPRQHSVCFQDLSFNTIAMKLNSNMLPSLPEQ